VQQALQLQTQGQDGDQETCPGDKCEVADNQVLPTKGRACTRWSLPEAVRPQRGQEMLVVWKDSSTDTRAHLLPSLPIETPAEWNLEGGGTGDGLESGQMQTCAGL
jgi:hypothetical protein